MVHNQTVALKHGSVDYTSAFGAENKSRIIDRNAQTSHKFSIFSGNSTMTCGFNSPLIPQNGSQSPRINDQQANYSLYKSLKTGQALLSNYSQIKKDDIRRNKVRKFSNDGQDNLHFLEKQLGGSAIRRKESNHIELYNQLEKQGIGKRLHRQNSSIEERMVLDERKKVQKNKNSSQNRDLGMRTLGSQASEGSSKVLFQSASSQVDLKPHGRIETTSDEHLEEIENQYPFQTQVKGGDFSINTMPIRVSMKRPAEFEDPHKLSRGQVVAINTGVDISYTRNRGSRAKTQGLFATDPQRASVF